jgi:hypothetical protein
LEAFAIFRKRAWEELVEEISWEMKGIVDAFLHWGCPKENSRITTYNSLQLPPPDLGCVQEIPGI